MQTEIVCRAPPLPLKPMKTAKHIEVGYLHQFRTSIHWPDWIEQARAAHAQGQSITEFVAHCLPHNRIIARKAYKHVQKMHKLS